jgi:AcrR family transcriptional regulator
MASSRDRLVEAAFALFDERGFEGTTVDDVAERAGVGRSTFFRAFGSKEDVIFPDHATVLGAINTYISQMNPLGKDYADPARVLGRT